MPFIERYIKNRLLVALKVNPIVFLNGPRQAGKSTLVQNIAKNEFPADYVTFDNATQMAAAAASPKTYLQERKNSLIIDEVQLVPDIFRALKNTIDELRQAEMDKVKGRFLITGSANIMALPKLSDPLVGRMSVLTLYPLSGAEIMHGKGDFIDRIFAHDFVPEQSESSLLEIIQAATFPEISNATQEESAIWFEGYLTTILQRDVRSLAEIEKLSILPHLLHILANRAGKLVNDAEIARDAGLNPVTARNYKTLLKMLFLIVELAPWHRNIGKRLVKAPKIYMVDTLFLSHLMQYNLADLKKNRPELFGHVLENFVATELLKLIENSGQKVNLLHFRTSDNKEVDFVLEKATGQLAGIEVKKSDRVDKSDFKGLEELQRLAGNDFSCGVVLYNGTDVVPFGSRLWAVPVANLWK